MKYTVTNTLTLLLFLMCQALYSQPDLGTVPFDCPDVPPPRFQFDLDSRVIALVMEDPTSDVAPIFKSVNNLYLRNYQNRSGNFKKLVQYYSEALRARGWRVLGRKPRIDPEKDNLYISVLHRDEIVSGVFVIIKSGDGVYGINIVGEIPLAQLGPLLRNLNTLGIEIQRLMSLRDRDLQLAPIPEPIKPDPSPAPKAKDASTEPPLPKNLEPTKSLKWQADGKPIHEIRIENLTTPHEVEDPESTKINIAAEMDKIRKVLQEGSGELEKIMPVLAEALGEHPKTVSLRIMEEGEKRIAVISLVPAEKISILKSMQISGNNSGSHGQVKVNTFFVPQGYNAEIPPATTRFMAKDVPVHELHIQGNQKIPEARIRQALENASKDIDKALQTLFKAIPYFEEINLQVNEKEKRYIATITVTEKPLSTDAYLGFSPLMRFGFNRVTGWEIGTGFKVGKRKDVGPLWMWNIRETQSDQTSRLFGRISYAFGNPHLHYRIGGIANWGRPYAWNIGMIAQVHRSTVAVAHELFPGYNRARSIFQRILGAPDLQNYYLQQGAAVSLRWSPTLSIHSLNLTAITESHASLRKNTDWFITNWGSKLSLRENPSITDGQMRSLIFQYDFNNRVKTLGWHNTLLVEHSSPAVGSDFDFTRLQLHLRYAFPLANDRIRTRFLFGFSNTKLPIQRQFVIDGMGGLRGYPWRRQEIASEGIITYDSGYMSSPYVFTGDRGFLINVEYHYRLSNLLRSRFFEKFFLVAFLDEGQVWEASDAAYTFDPKANIGIGLQIGEDDTVTVVNINGLHSGEDVSVFRVNIAKALESGPGIQMTIAWYHNF